MGFASRDRRAATGATVARVARAIYPRKSRARRLDPGNDLLR
jgi:hypothetical protein